MHSFLRVNEVGLDGCQNHGRKKYIDLDTCKIVVNQPSVDSLISAALPGHKFYTFLHKRSFRHPNIFSSYLNQTLSLSRKHSSPAKFRNRHLVHIGHLNIQVGRERRETNRDYISALCNRESWSTKTENNCIALLLLISIYSFDLTSIQYQRLLWCLTFWPWNWTFK